MSIEAYIKRRAKHIAVYWGTPTLTNDGHTSFTTPVELFCIWKDSTDLLRTDQGREIVIRAEVYVSEDLDEKGMLYLGRLTDLTTAQKADPRKVATAYEIKKFIKTPSLLRSTDYNRKVIL